MIMRVFVAGATGTLGRPVVQDLLAHGHEVVGLTRSADGAKRLERAGARAVVADALDAEGLRAAVGLVRPDQVVHLLTAIPPAGPLRPKDMQGTNRLRVAGTTNLIRAAVEAGAARIVAESFVGVYWPIDTATPLRETDPLSPVTGGPLRETVLAMRSMEEQLRQARDGGRIDTVVLRIGFLYGSDVPSTRAMLDQARRHLLFLPRNLSGIGPFVHVSDAAAAIVASVEASRTSPVYNIADDEAMSLRDFSTQFTRAFGTRPPRNIPGWLARLAAPFLAEVGAAKLRVSNARAKQELGWRLRYPTFREGLAEVRQLAREAA
jgi:nucleoside-diphosphate-sugar epimerase